MGLRILARAGRTLRTPDGENWIYSWVLAKGPTAGNVADVVRLTGHGGAHAVAAARQHGVSVMFTLSGGHVFPLYDAVVSDGADAAMRLVDVRHEQTAVFAAEATARLTRTPGLAVVTAGPGVTNCGQRGDHRVVQRRPGRRAGRPRARLPLGLAAACRRWIIRRCSRRSPSGPGPSTTRPRLAGSVDEAFRLAASPHRGPVFLDISLEAIYGQAEADLRTECPVDRPGHPRPDAG